MHAKCRAAGIARNLAFARSFGFRVERAEASRRDTLSCAGQPVTTVNRATTPQCNRLQENRLTESAQAGPRRSGAVLSRYRPRGATPPSRFPSRFRSTRPASPSSFIAQIARGRCFSSNSFRFALPPVSMAICKRTTLCGSRISSTELFPSSTRSSTRDSRPLAAYSPSDVLSRLAVTEPRRRPSLNHQMKEPVSVALRTMAGLPCGSTMLSLLATISELRGPTVLIKKITPSVAVPPIAIVLRTSTARSNRPMRCTQLIQLLHRRRPIRRDRIRARVHLGCAHAIVRAAGSPGTIRRLPENGQGGPSEGSRRARRVSRPEIRAVCPNRGIGVAIHIRSSALRFVEVDDQGCTAGSTMTRRMTRT